MFCLEWEFQFWMQKFSTMKNKKESWGFNRTTVTLFEPRDRLVWIEGSTARASFISLGFIRTLSRTITRANMASSAGTTKKSDISIHTKHENSWQMKRKKKRKQTETNVNNHPKTNKNLNKTNNRNNVNICYSKTKHFCLRSKRSRDINKRKQTIITNLTNVNKEICKFNI